MVQGGKRLISRYKIVSCVQEGSAVANKIALAIIFVSPLLMLLQWNYA